MPDPRIKRIAEVTLSKWSANLEKAHIESYKFGGHRKHGGSQWAVLQPVTIRKKGHNIILVDSGKLQDSIFVDVSGLKMLIGTDRVYATFLQKGTKFMPARVVITITNQDIDALTKSLVKNLGGSGFTVRRT